MDFLVTSLPRVRTKDYAKAKFRVDCEPPGIFTLSGERMSKYPFLSPEWIDQVRIIRTQFADQAPQPAHHVRMNQVVTAVPFGDGQINAHMDTTEGELKIDLGHLDNADLTITLDYLTAKAILVEGNAQAGMQAFMSGKVTIDPPEKITVLMAFQNTASEESATKLAAAIQAITE